MRAGVNVHEHLIRLGVPRIAVLLCEVTWPWRKMHERAKTMDPYPISLSPVPPQGGAGLQRSALGN